MSARNGLRWVDLSARELEPKMRSDGFGEAAEVQTALRIALKSKSRIERHFASTRP